MNQKKIQKTGKSRETKKKRKIGNRKNFNYNSLTLLAIYEMKSELYLI